MSSAGIGEHEFKRGELRRVFVPQARTGDPLMCVPNERPLKACSYTAFGNAMAA